MCLLLIDVAELLRQLLHLLLQIIQVVLLDGFLGLPIQLIEMVLHFDCAQVQLRIFWTG